MNQITKTKAQLEFLGYPRIGIQLKDGGKMFGWVDEFTPDTIYIRDAHGDVLDVPRRIIVRAFLCLNGGKEDEPTGFSAANKSRQEGRA
jgi:hypothetical protein